MSTAPWPELPLKRLLRPVSPGAVAIKGSLADLDESEGYPAYSASGQDVRVEVPQFSTDGIVLSAVGAQCGKCFHARGAWSVVANTQPFLPTEKADARFMFYVVNQSNFWEIGGSAQPYVQVPRTLPKPVPAPPLETQKRIAAFLDEKIARIDALIAKKQALLDRLAEKRQAIITQAVTKGLDPAAPMMDSGIDWLGQIPAHWESKRLKRVKRFLTSGSRGWGDYYSDEGDIFLRMTNVTKCGIEIDATDLRHVTLAGVREGTRTATQVGDILITITAELGSVAIVRAAHAGAYINQHIALFRPDHSECDPEYLVNFLWSEVTKAQFELSGQGGTKQGLGFDQVDNVMIALPPLAEQREIAQRVASVRSEFDAVETLVSQSINSLVEYRAALVTAAVTGQIEGLQ